MAQNIRNFSIISHIDAGKSTLADRLLEITGTVPKDKLRPQHLDNLSQERRHGITIKMQPVRLIWQAPNQEIRSTKQEARNKFQTSNSNDPNYKQNLEIENWELKIPGLEYILNLIDTPGHTDFSYEVSRALRAVEGAVLLIDAVRGVQAQTLSTLRAAQEAGLTIIPVINKIDLKNAQIPQVIQQIKAVLNTNQEPLKISAKTGQGIPALLAAIINKIPAPQNDSRPTTNDQRQPLKALIFDSYYDNFSGIIAIVRVFQGSLKKDQKLRLINTQKEFSAKKVGVFTPNEKAAGLLTAGAIGWVATGIKEPRAVPVGETLGQSSKETLIPLAGFKIPKAKVFADFFPHKPDNFSDFIKKLQQLQLNDPALNLRPIQSKTFGRGAQLGCLGQLHLQIAKERLAEASGFKIISTPPTVAYQGQTLQGTIEPVTNPMLLRQKEFQEIREPWIKLTITVPQKYLGPALKLVETTRAQNMEIRPLGNAPRKHPPSHQSSTQIIEAEVPLQDTFLTDFYDALKSGTQGYGSADYEFLEYRKTDLMLLEILLAGEPLPDLSRIIPKSKALPTAQKEAARLKNILPRQVFSLAIQIGITPFKSLPEGRPKIIARHDLPALKKKVTAGLYGGDFTRKKKLLVKQRKGQKRLAQTGRLTLPREVYTKLLSNL